MLASMEIGAGCGNSEDRIYHFGGNPVKFTSFMHNFETCLGKNNNNEALKLQLLIQDCHGKAKEAIGCQFVCRTRVPCSKGNSERELW